MAKVNTYFQSFNTGVHDKSALARVDLERMRLAAEIQTNFLPQAVGPGFMRPGTEYLTSTAGNNEAMLKEFIFGVSDAALFEFTNQSLRVILDDVPITRQAVSSAVTNGNFAAGAGWNTAGINGGTATIAGGVLIISGTNVNGTGRCIQTVITSSPNVEHALRIVVLRGPVQFKCGSTAGGQDYISQTILTAGEHSLAFTPTGAYWIEFDNSNPRVAIIDSIQVESAGVMTLPTPWPLSDLPLIRIGQSADVCFVACKGYQQRRIERRGRRSWSVALYQADDGPFDAPSDQSIRLKPDALNGNTTLTASSSYFTPNHVGCMFRLDHSGQNVAQTLASEDTHTDAIRVTGIHGSAQSDRRFVYNISGTWSGTLALERSYDSEDAGYNVDTTVSANGTYTQNDDSDNSIIWYRVGFEPGGYTSGTALVQIGYAGGGGFGICRVTDYISPTSVSIEILTPFKNSVFTNQWRLGQWSNLAGWPSAVGFEDGRLCWSGSDRFWGSVSDAFASFDEEVEGDSGPISRSIATGGVNDTQWLLSLQRLLIGTDGTVSTVKSSSLDEPITPTNFSIRDSSTTGCSAISPVKIDTRGIFVERAGTALIELTFDGSVSDFKASQISKLTTDLFSSGIKTVAVQRRPDTRIWLVMQDGTCVCMLYEPEDQVLAFIPVETDGEFESVAVLPSAVQDRVYFSVKRTINNADVRYIEKMALDSETKPANLCKVMDAFATGTNSPAAAIVNVGTHLQGETVVIWADGAPIEISEGNPAQFVVDSSGNITLPAPVTNWVAGLPYRARWKSARLAYGAQMGTAMLQKKAVDNLGMVITDFVRAGIRYGTAFDDPFRPLDRLPIMVDGATQPAIVLSDIRDEEQFSFPGQWSIDSRVCLECTSPYTMMALGLVIQVTNNDS